MAKSKANFQDLLLKKGEYIVLGVAGAALVLLLALGVMTYTSEAKDPKAISEKLVSKSKNIDAAIGREAEPGAVPPLEDWAKPGKPGGYAPVPVRDFPLSTVMFDPTARPDTKRENPRVWGIGDDYQVDLVRAPMKAHDIVYDTEGNAKIAVRVVKKQSEADKDKIKAALSALQRRGKAGAKAAATPPPKGPGGPAGPAGSATPPPGGPGGRGPGGPGAPPFGAGGEGPGGYPGEGGFNQAGFRTETALTYIPLEDLDKAFAEGKLPAMTVVPLRMAVVNATFPFKKQAEEMKRALRMKNVGDAAPFVKFDGFDVKRRQITPDGVIAGTGKKYAEVAGTKDDNTVGWYDYPYELKYQEMIASRMLNSYVEGADPNSKSPTDQYLPYFYRYEDNLVMFLPELVTELGRYPELKLPPILNTIAKMKEAATPKYEPSALISRLKGNKDKDGNVRKAGIFAPAGTAETGAGALYGPAAGMGLMAPKGVAGEGAPGAPVAPAVEVDDILIRFVDPDVRPGHTYEYMVRVRLLNPNHRQPQFMTNPDLAGDKYRVLPGPWTRLTQSLTVPSESYLFAYDPAAYDAEVKAAYGKDRAMLRRFELPPGNTHAVVEKLTWLEQVRVDAGNQREPVGAWVAAEMPVPRGGFVGRKTYVKLPLWSSEDSRYTLREIQTEKVGKGKDAVAPKGWLVDFAGRDVLVDFDGGKVTTRVGTKVVVEDVATDLLIARPDGRLVVRNSAADTANEERKRDTAEWAKWVRDVEANQSSGGAGGPGGFERPGAGGVPPPPGKN
jgi:hypothetical protein